MSEIAILSGVGFLFTTIIVGGFVWLILSLKLRGEWHGHGPDYIAKVCCKDVYQMLVVGVTGLLFFWLLDFWFLNSKEFWIKFVRGLGAEEWEEKRVVLPLWLGGFAGLFVGELVGILMAFLNNKKCRRIGILGALGFNRG